MHNPIRILLQQKGSDFFWVAPTATVTEAVRDMNRRGVGALMVMAGDEPVGIFTERDVLRRVVDAGRDPATTTVGEVMTREVVTVKPTITVEDAMTVVTQKRCRHLPVMEAGKVLGLLSSGDLTRWATRERDVQIQQLVNYITSKYPA